MRVIVTLLASVVSVRAPCSLYRYSVVPETSEISWVRRSRSEYW